MSIKPLTIFLYFFFFFFNDTATTEIYTLSLHDAPDLRPPGTLRRCLRSQPRRRARGLRDRGNSQRARRRRRAGAPRLSQAAPRAVRRRNGREGSQLLQ